MSTAVVIRHAKTFIRRYFLVTLAIGFTVIRVAAIFEAD